MKLFKTLESVETHISSADEPDFDRIDFDWEDIHFKAHSEVDRNGGFQIRLSANMGRLYFNIEDTAQRAMALERIYNTNRGIDGTYRILSGGMVKFENITHTDEKILGKDLMSALTLILLESETHLRALRSHLKN